MKLTKLHLIIILALALILCPVLGVCYNSNSSINTYNYSEGFGPAEEMAVLNEGMSGGGYPLNQVYEGMSGQSVDRLQEGYDVLTEGYAPHNPDWGVFSEGMTMGDVLAEGYAPHIPEIALHEGYNRHAR